MQEATDLEISAGIRRELSSRRVDLGKLKFTVSGGIVTVSGELAFVGLEKTPEEKAVEMKFIESSLRMQRGVKDIQFNLENLTRTESGKWEPLNQQPAQASENEVFHCPECQKVFKFCPYCGKPLAAGLPAAIPVRPSTPIGAGVSKPLPRKLEPLRPLPKIPAASPLSPSTNQTRVSPPVSQPTSSGISAGEPKNSVPTMRPLEAKEVKTPAPTPKPAASIGAGFRSLSDAPVKSAAGKFDSNKQDLSRPSLDSQRPNTSMSGRPMMKPVSTPSPSTSQPKMEKTSPVSEKSQEVSHSPAAAPLPSAIKDTPRKSGAFEQSQETIDKNLISTPAVESDTAPVSASPKVENIQNIEGGKKEEIHPKPGIPHKELPQQGKDEEGDFFDISMLPPLKAKISPEKEKTPLSKPQQSHIKPQATASPSKPVSPVDSSPDEMESLLQTIDLPPLSKTEAQQKPVSASQTKLQDSPGHAAPQKPAETQPTPLEFPSLEDFDDSLLPPLKVKQSQQPDKKANAIPPAASQAAGDDETPLPPLKPQSSEPKPTTAAKSAPDAEDLFAALFSEIETGKGADKTAKPLSKQADKKDGLDELAALDLDMMDLFQKPPSKKTSAASASTQPTTPNEPQASDDPFNFGGFLDLDAPIEKQTTGKPDSSTKQNASKSDKDKQPPSDPFDLGKFKL